VLLPVLSPPAANNQHHVWIDRAVAVDVDSHLARNRTEAFADIETSRAVWQESDFSARACRWRHTEWHGRFIDRDRPHTGHELGAINTGRLCRERDGVHLAIVFGIAAVVSGVLRVRDIGDRVAQCNEGTGAGIHLYLISPVTASGG